MIAFVVGMQGILLLLVVLAMNKVKARLDALEKSKEPPPTSEPVGPQTWLS
jgi:hypothetical protein